MDKFMYIFKGGMDNDPGASAEAMQAHMQKWMQWMQKLTQEGTMIAGEPLQPEGKKISGAKKIVTDGPFAEAKEMVGGYLIVNANDLDHATDIAKDCPIFEVNGEVEVRPIRKM